MDSIDNLRGVIPPIVTPINADFEEIDKDGLTRIVEYLIQNYVNGIFALGTCGEFTGFTNSKKIEIIEHLTKVIQHRVPLLVGITEASTAKVLQLYYDLRDFKPDFLVLSPPYYYHYSPQQIEQFYLTIADNVQIPIILYNIPHLTKNEINLESISKIYLHQNIMGIKDSSGDFIKFQDILFNFQCKKFKVFQGIEKLSLVSLIIGADGIVPGLANIIPKSFSELYLLSLKKEDHEQAFLIQKKINYIASIFNVNPWIGGLKQAMEILGLCKNIPCSPYKPVDEHSKQLILKIMSENSLINGDLNEYL